MCQQKIAIRQNSSTRNATSKILGQPNAHPWLGQRPKSPYSANPEMLGQQTIFSASLQDSRPAHYSTNFQHVQANDFGPPNLRHTTSQRQPPRSSASSKRPPRFSAGRDARPADDFQHQEGKPWPANESANSEDPMSCEKTSIRSLHNFVNQPRQAGDSANPEDPCPVEQVFAASSCIARFPANSQNTSQASNSLASKSFGHQRQFLRSSACNRSAAPNSRPSASKRSSAPASKILGQQTTAPTSSMCQQTIAIR